MMWVGLIQSLKALVGQRLSFPQQDGILLVYFLWIFKKDFIYLFMKDTWRERERERERERKAETQVEGGADSMQGVQCGLDPGSPGSHLGLKMVLTAGQPRLPFLWALTSISP